jgi:NADH dehydrogenase (ubiquinone) 1 alpha subcomplex subunit 5
MRPSMRLFATVKQASSKYLTPNAPTGLTGLSTHPAPRCALVYLYRTTLSLLQKIPAQSAYRASVEALTKHRLSIIESVKPPGYDEWAAKAKRLVEENPDIFGEIKGKGEAKNLAHWIGDERFVMLNIRAYEEDPGDMGEGLEWDGEPAGMLRNMLPTELKGAGRPAGKRRTVNWEPEPSLEASQYVGAFASVTRKYANEWRRVAEIEERIGAGLIEEVISVAMGELKLAKTMIDHKVYVPTVLASWHPGGVLTTLLQVGRDGRQSSARPVGVFPARHGCDADTAVT